MATQLVKPSIDDLELLRPEATQNGQVSEDEWVKRNCELNASLLRKDPRRYRSFGPYWWVLKESMHNNGITDFGEFIDKEGCNLCQYDTPFHSLLAAWIYSENAIDSGLMYANEHIVSYLPDEADQENDAMPYVVADDEMELLAIQANLQ